MIETNLITRWEDGLPHHKKSEALYKRITENDMKYGNDFLDLSSGGDGDNGEHLMYLLDIIFEEDAE